ncbi:hypothetical protein ACFWXO_05130 [Kitasatospora sp. NPDC059088]|uniref:hypothetical protein n=1 Tax=Kitasatospora sp. NPDC059088 TaxID=3346722 RepID=UPI0036A2426A
MGMVFGEGEYRRIYGFGEYQMFETPNIGGYRISYGGFVFLESADRTAVARIPLRVERRNSLEGVQEAAALEMEPWAPAVVKLAAARRATAQAQGVRDAGEELRRSQGQHWDEERDEQLVGYIRQHATAEERSTSGETWTLADKVAARLDAEQRALMQAASEALPDAAVGPLPDFDEDWQQVAQPSYDSWLDRIRPLVIARWAEADAGAGRDHMIVWVMDHGRVSKLDLHRRTGIARTTIDRVLAAAGRS